MRKHDVRKWLHAVLDLIPVILIPVFMVYSHRHSLTSPVTRVEPEPVYYQSNDVTTFTDFNVDYIYQYNDNYTYQGNLTSNTFFFNLKDLDITKSSCGIPLDDRLVSMYISSSNNRLQLLSVRTDNTQRYTNVTNKVFTFGIDLILEGLTTVFSSDSDFINCFSKSNQVVIEDYVDVTITEDLGTSIVVPQNEVVDFNQLLPIKVVDTTQEYFSITDNINFVENHIYIFKPLPILNFNGSYYLNTPYTELSSVEPTRFTNISTTQGIFCYNADLVEFDYTLKNQLFDLTQMFGSDNEPTIEQFEQWFPNDYYSYTLSSKQLIKGVSTITYDDTDVMSQIIYQLYNSVDKYFNMGNVFNMTGVYDWFNLNIFNGNAPISIYIVWNIVLYEFVMDLLFLLYGLFMWFIDMVEKLMEKPLKSVK